MTALEIAAGVTSLIVVAFYIIVAAYIIRIARDIILDIRLVIDGLDFALMIASTFGAVWFAARLWGFA
jgi:hypothetical protein